jgi:thioester reductase-like protein
MTEIITAERRAADLETAIAAIAARLSKEAEASAEADPCTPFALLGLDSLGTIELAAAVEDALGIELPPDLVADCPDARSLARRLHRRSICDTAIEDPVAEMFADGVLPADIRAALKALGRSARGTSAASTSRSGLLDATTILLTGATGFLGGWLARELLERSAAHLLCLVRPSSTSAAARLRQRLLHCGIPAETIDARVTAIDGDLSRPLVGLTNGDLNELTDRVDAICHAGAAVNWIQSYRSLRSQNVDGTVELLRLASRSRIPFHFISSLSVCYSTSAPREVDEEFDPFTHLRELHLGYAQTKAVAEALVREAGTLGLPITVYRPSLIAGHGATGEFNADDLLALLLKGCIEMGAAPDLDWTLDALPVDVVAARILDLSHMRGIFHLAHSRPRHWRECVLWMRLYGYPIRLISYHAWLRQLERDTTGASAASEGHPLRALRSFFLNRPPGANGLTLPELYEDRRRAHACHDATWALLGKDSLNSPDLDAALLDRYFRAFVASGHLRAPSGGVTGQQAAHSSALPVNQSRNDAAFDVELFSRALAAHGTVLSAVRLRRDFEHSIVSELTAWRSGRPIGLFEYRLEIEAGGSVTSQQVILKLKAKDTEVNAVARALAHLCDERIGLACSRWQDRIGFAQSHLRELALYQQADPRIVRHVPRLLGSVRDDHAGVWAIVLERIADAAVLDSVNRSEPWHGAAIRCAISGLATLHAVWFGREGELRAQPWIGHVPSTTTILEMSDLWTALAAHASPAFGAWADPAVCSIQRRLVGEIRRWAPALEELPRTLIHNDFNPRNICLRNTSSGPVLCAYDWELARVGAPQRDLAELLCFVLPSDTSDIEIDTWIECHRRALEREIGFHLDRHLWLAGFRAALYELMIDRLPMYALVNRVRRQSFLPRVVRTWRRLYERFPIGGDA